MAAFSPSWRTEALPPERARLAGCYQTIEVFGPRRPHRPCHPLPRAGRERFVREAENSVASRVFCDGALDAFQKPRFPRPF